MKNKIVLFAAFVLVLASCSQPTGSSGKPTSSEQAGTCTYTCTMDPEVCSNKPGACPKCGMELVEKE